MNYAALNPIRSWPLRLAPLLVLAVSAACFGQPVPDYGFTWATVTHPGNRPANSSEAPSFYPPNSNPPLVKGRVDYAYRIAKTEVTSAQWVEFANAYAPYHTGGRFNSHFTGPYISPTELNPALPPAYRVAPGYENVATTMSWYFAARFCNWLHHNKAGNREAFENGAYDASTFVGSVETGWPIPADRSPGARYWLPTLDEWTKAVYYDPNRYGPGQEGYWKRPNGQDRPLIPGFPEEGGQTSAGIPLPPDGSPPRPIPVGAYPDVQSPWGLLDASGTVGEWMGDGPNQINYRYGKGSLAFLPYDNDRSDKIDTLGAGLAHLGGAGFRVASIVPAPSVFVCTSMLGMGLFRRRRRDRGKV
jgi:formylglycine-generating enzyme required for sulfatase activity